jgi:hypothetical protein
MKSLWEFYKNRQPPFSVRFDAGLPAMLKHPVIMGERSVAQASLMTLPLYLASELSRLIKSVQEPAGTRVANV